MAVSKALYKSATLRAQNTDIGLLMSAANAEVSRDNPQMLFVTAFAGILDLETGELEYCNAGHENPFLFHPTDAQVRRIEDGDGPPLCAMSDLVYEGGHYAMRQDELLCVVTDGVTEAVNRADEMYGSARVLAILPRLAARQSVRARRGRGAARRRGHIRGGRGSRRRSHDSRVEVARSVDGALTGRRALRKRDACQRTYPPVSNPGYSVMPPSMYSVVPTR